MTDKRGKLQVSSVILSVVLRAASRRIRFSLKHQILCGFAIIFSNILCFDSVRGKIVVLCFQQLRAKAHRCDRCVIAFRAPGSFQKLIGQRAERSSRTLLTVPEQFLSIDSVAA